MAYNKKKIFEQAKTLIESENLIFVDEVVSFLPCDRATFYRMFPQECDECDTLKEMIQKNKVKIKVSLRAKWYESDNATLQMALMKIICTEEERRALSMTHNVVEGGDKPIIIDFID
jgi:hypothetical protein